MHKRPLHNALLSHSSYRRSGTQVELANPRNDLAVRLPLRPVVMTLHLIFCTDSHRLLPLRSFSACVVRVVSTSRIKEVILEAEEAIADIDFGPGIENRRWRQVALAHVVEDRRRTSASYWSHCLMAGAGV